MRIIKNTPDRLILRDSGWILGLLAIAAIVIVSYFVWEMILEEEWSDAGKLALFGLGLPALVLMSAVRRDELILDRATGKMHFRHSTFFGRESDQFDLDLLERASTQTGSSSGSSSRQGHRLALILKNHPRRNPHTHPTKDIRVVSPIYRGRSMAENAAKAINKWYENA